MKNSMPTVGGTLALAGAWIGRRQHQSQKTRGGSLASSSVWKPGSPTRSPRLPLTGSSVGSGFVLIAGGLALFIIVNNCHSRHEVQIEDSDDDPLSSQVEKVANDAT